MVNGLEILDDGTHLETDVKRATLDSTKVYCVVDYSAKNIYLWIGSTANVRLRFVGAQTAASVRSDVGVHYKVRSIDDGEEPNGFFDLLNGGVTGPGTTKPTSPSQSHH
ncbi:MAG: hypothetical protein RTU92_12450 [Candidatus Thorarchaeota archaeon]